MVHSIQKWYTFSPGTFRQWYIKSDIHYTLYIDEVCREHITKYSPPNIVLIKARSIMIVRWNDWPVGGIYGGGGGKKIF